MARTAQISKEKRHEDQSMWKMSIILKGSSSAVAKKHQTL
jgi:hypothetical protein